MNFIFNKSQAICYLMLTLIIIYYCQGILYPSGTILSQIVLLILLLISSIYFVFFRTISEARMNGFVRAWTAFLIINIVYFLWDGSLLYINEFQGVLLNMLPFYAFYVFAEKGVLKRKHLISFFIVLLPIIIVKFLQSNVELQELRDRDNVVDNTVYMFLGLLPFVFLFKRKILVVASLLILWVFLVQSAKRAAILSGVIVILLFFYYLFKYPSNKKNIYWQYIFSLALIIIVSVWGYRYYIQNEFLVGRINSMLDGNSSGRDVLSAKIFDAWYHSDNVINYLLGNGFRTSVEVTARASHNDWIDILASFGLVGFISYFLIFYKGSKVFFNPNWHLIKKMSFVAIILIGLLTSLTSRWYWSSFPYSQMLLLPYLLATYNRSDD